MISIGNWIHDYIDLLWKIDDDERIGSTVGGYLELVCFIENPGQRRKLQWEIKIISRSIRLLDPS